ncbi:hypothetical protein PHLGIDRAFT_12565 [Phlebiopsis gigantea 11061_1 CR5-6]|uniref:HNH nuclease domain-containing protein n=1 Tax=Phlebiopsis gigantea (strain 11061_1 CR5-6) TaxID=745531 RepID=A0A0C3PNN4_PHLG1|nr:hypothetical protein PHLGIDRAFT_12565 [Phlebiopsis gigantea 11061_1 CR5-6]
MPPVVRVTPRVIGYGLLLASNATGCVALVRDILALQDQPYLQPQGPDAGCRAIAYSSMALALEVSTQHSHIFDPSSSKASDLRVLPERPHINIMAWLPDLAQSNVDAASVAHIISQSLSENIHGITPDHRRAKFGWARTAGTVIERFGGFKACFDNAFVSCIMPHKLFDGLEIWLTPVTDEGRIIPDTHSVSQVKGKDGLLHMAKFKRLVVFKDLCQWQDYSSPEPRIIELHAACANIAHMSGAAEHLREFYRDTESIAIMTEPNAAYELSHALKTVQLCSTTP